MWESYVYLLLAAHGSFADLSKFEGLYDLMQMQGQFYRTCLFHPMDPRGIKLGGIETHVRLILSAYPSDFSILFVGVDEHGDCRLGEVTSLTICGRKIAFLPVVKVSENKINLASKTIRGSLTLRYALGALRYLPRIKAALKGSPASVELQRYEFAMLPKLLGRRFVLMIHNEGSKDDEMDSLLKRYWFLHLLNERIAVTLADRIFGVNPNIVARIARLYPSAARKIEMMTVSIDTHRFVARPFDCSDGVFKIVFAGRLDAFKDPPLMFGVLRDLHARLEGRFLFHYVGPTDPHRYAEFAQIEHFTVRHGSRTSEEVASILGQCHAGILTSYFEGMPCYLLECLSTGRPVGAIRLPQYEPLIIENISGSLVDRSDPVEACRNALVDAFLTLWDKIRTGEFDQTRIHACVEPYSVEIQMSRLFACHRALQQSGFKAAPAPLL
jgi:glycosyltransferase involved in cell wall biosynthesis